MILSVSAQTKITFEDQTLNGAAVMYGGTVNVAANPVTTGINSSAYCIDVVNNGYAPVKFVNFNIPAGLAATYQYAKLKFKIAYKAFNGGTDLNYPQVDIYSASTFNLDATEKLGTVSNVWGDHTTDSLVWKNVEFVFSTSSLASIPQGVLVLKIAKPKCEYLIDDLELMAATTSSTLFDFESNAIGDSYTTINIYGGTVASTAKVVANPTDATKKSLEVTSTAYNQAASFTVVLPNGKLLTDYSKLTFDRYSTTTNYAQAYIYADAVEIYKDASGYPSQGSAATWVTKEYDLPATVSASNSFALKIGYTSMNSGAYLLDNIKLVPKTSTDVHNQENGVLIIRDIDNSFVLNKTAQILEVYNLQGRLMESLMNTNLMDQSKLSAGIYLIKALIDGEKYVTKVVKK